MTSRLTLLAAAAAFAIPSLPAADSLPPVDTELITLSIGGQLSGLYYMNDGKPERMVASPQGISPPVIYKGPRIISFHHSKAELSTEGSEPACSVSLPADTDRNLLVFTITRAEENENNPEPTATEETPGEPEPPAQTDDSETPKQPAAESPVPPPSVSAKVHGISEKSFGEGDYRLFNFTEKEVRMELGELLITIEPGATQDIKGESLGKEVVSLKSILSLKQEDGSFRRIYSSMWGHRPERRSFLFFFDNEKASRRPITIKRFYDLPSIKATHTSFGDDEEEEQDDE